LIIHSIRILIQGSLRVGKEDRLFSLKTVKDFALAGFKYFHISLKLMQHSNNFKHRHHFKLFIRGGRKMKRVIILGLVILVLSALILAGCSQSPSTSAPTKAASQTAGQSPAKVYTLKYADFIPPQDVFAQQPEAWAKDLDKASGGRIKVTFFHAESLVKMPDLLDAVSAGTADIAMIDASLTPARLPITDMTTLPMLFKKSSQAAQSFLALYAKYKELRDEYEAAGVKVIWAHMPGPTQLVTKSQVRTVDDLKGLKIGTVTPRESAAIKLLGATPVALPMPEHYTALERGVIDGSSNDLNAAFIWKLIEVTKYRTNNIDLSQRDCPIILNLKTYNNLPQDLKQIFDQTTDSLAMSKKVNLAAEEFFAFTYNQTVEYDKKMGNPGVYSLPADERQKWFDKVVPVRDQWVNEMQAKNLPAKGMLDDLVKFADQYK
jgi:TRAP-type C4-dicarboxylate transport system substrate-binding protein